MKGNLLWKGRKSAALAWSNCKESRIRKIFRIQTVVRVAADIEAADSQPLPLSKINLQNSVETLELRTLLGLHPPNHDLNINDLLVGASPVGFRRTNQISEVTGFGRTAGGIGVPDDTKSCSPEDASPSQSRKPPQVFARGT